MVPTELQSVRRTTLADRSRVATDGLRHLGIAGGYRIRLRRLGAL